MRPGVRLALAWAALLGGLVLVLKRVPMPGVGGQESAAVPAGPLLMPSGSPDEEVAWGLEALEKGKAAEAAGRFDRAAALAPADPSPHVMKAFALARIEPLDEAAVREALARAAALGFDRAVLLARHEKSAASGAPPGPGRYHLERAILLAFGGPPDPEAARRALEAAREAGTAAPPGLDGALPQVAAFPGR